MKRLCQSALGAGATVYTVPIGFDCEVRDICISNTTGSPVDCAIHLVTSGGSATTSNQLFPSVQVPGNTLVQWTGVQAMRPTDFIYASGTGITLTISGDERRAVS